MSRVLNNPKKFLVAGRGEEASAGFCGETHLGEMFRGDLRPRTTDKGPFKGLAQETHPDIFWDDLFLLGHQAEEREDLQLAATVFSYLNQKSPNAKLRKRSAARLAGITGLGGTLGGRLEHHGRFFLDQAFAPNTLAGMGAAGLAFSGGRLFTLARLSRSSLAPALGTWGIKGAGFVGGFAAEVPSFVFAEKGAAQLLGHEVDWKTQSLKQELIGSAALLGALKIFSFGGSWLSKRYLDPSLKSVLPRKGPWSDVRGPTSSHSTWQQQLTQKTIQETSNLLGLMAGHEAQAWALGIEAPDGTRNLLDSLALHLQFKFTGTALHSGFRGLRSFNHRLETKSQEILISSRQNPFVPRLAWAGVSGTEGLGLPHQLWMEGTPPPALGKPKQKGEGIKALALRKTGLPDSTSPRLRKWAFKWGLRLKKIERALQYIFSGQWQADGKRFNFRQLSQRSGSSQSNGLHEKILQGLLKERAAAAGRPALEIAPQTLAAHRQMADSLNIHLEIYLARIYPKAPPELVEGWLNALELSPKEQITLIQGAPWSGGRRRLADLFALAPELLVEERAAVIRALGLMGMREYSTDLKEMGLSHLRPLRIRMEAAVALAKMGRLEESKSVLNSLNKRQRRRAGEVWLQAKMFVFLRLGGVAPNPPGPELGEPLSPAEAKALATRLLDPRFRKLVSLERALQAAQVMEELDPAWSLSLPKPRDQVSGTYRDTKFSRDDFQSQLPSWETIVEKGIPLSLNARSFYLFPVSEGDLLHHRYKIEALSSESILLLPSGWQGEGYRLKPSLEQWVLFQKFFQAGDEVLLID